MMLITRYAHFSTSKLMSFINFITLAYPSTTSEASGESQLDKKSLLASPSKIFMDDNFSRAKASTEVCLFYKRAAQYSFKPIQPRFFITGIFIMTKIRSPMNKTQPIRWDQIFTVSLWILKSVLKIGMKPRWPTL